MTQAIFAHACATQLVVGETRDRLGPAAQVVPELRDSPGSGKLPGEPDDCYRPLELRLSGASCDALADRRELGRLLVAPAHTSRDPLHGRVAEQVQDLDVRIQLLLKPLVHADHEQRVSAEIEEVVVDADVGAFEYH